MEQALNVQFPDPSLASVKHVPALLDDYVTFFDPGWSVVRLREAVRERAHIFWPQTWYDREALG